MCFGGGAQCLRKRTDLPLEARELWQESAERTTRLAGVKAVRRKLEGYPVTRVDILDERGERALGKPRGGYVTVDLTTFWQREDGLLRAGGPGGGRGAEGAAAPGGAGAGGGPGEPGMTADAVGPLAADSVLITRHLISAMPRQFAGFRPVAVFRTGVLGTTGVESAEAVRGLVERVRPALVIAIDALASRREGRVCAAVQLSDTGIIPGSGVGNHRAALNAETLGVPVFAVGVPTVVDAATLAADLLEESGAEAVDEERLRAPTGRISSPPGTSTSRSGTWPRSSATASTGPFRTWRSGDQRPAELRRDTPPVSAGKCGLMAAPLGGEFSRVGGLSRCAPHCRRHKLRIVRPGPQGKVSLPPLRLLSPPRGARRGPRFETSKRECAAPGGREKMFGGSVCASADLLPPAGEG